MNRAWKMGSSADQTLSIPREDGCVPSCFMGVFHLKKCNANFVCGNWSLRARFMIFLGLSSAETPTPS